MVDRPRTKGSQGYLLMITLVATFGGLLFGYDTAVISGTVKHLEAYFIDPLISRPDLALSVIHQFKVTLAVTVVLGLVIVVTILAKLYGFKKAFFAGVMLAIVSFAGMSYYLGLPPVIDETTASSIKGFTIASALIGCIVGGSIGGFISKMIGRKKGLLMAGLLFLVSAIGSAVPDRLNFFGSEVIISFIIYRMIGGVGVGLASMLSPMYIAEIAPAHIRGKLVSLNQFAIIFGMLVIYFVNMVIAKGQSETWLNMTGWRYMFASEVIPASLFIGLLLLVPETPRFLLLKGNDLKAMGLLIKINGVEKGKYVFDDIKNSLVERSAPWLTYGGMVIVIGILLSAFQQLVGINVVLYYAPEIFRTLGDGTDKSLLQTLIVGAINLTFTVVAIMSVDKFGRKPLQIIGALGMCVSMFGLGCVFFFEQKGLGALIFMLCYVASFAMSWGPVTWVLLSEIFPNAIRGAMSIAVAVQWIANLLISWTFPMMNDNSWLIAHFHNGFAYWLYGLMGLLAAWFVWKLVPETKGKTLEEIEGIWR